MITSCHSTYEDRPSRLTSISAGAITSPSSAPFYLGVFQLASQRVASATRQPSRNQQILWNQTISRTPRTRLAVERRLRAALMAQPGDNRHLDVRSAIRVDARSTLLDSRHCDPLLHTGILL